MTLRSFEDFHKEALKDPEVKKAYDKLDTKYKLIKMMITYRVENKLNQTAFANQIGIKQQALSRIEKGIVSPTLDMVDKIITAMDADVKFELKSQPVPKNHSKKTLKSNSKENACAGS